MQHPDEGTIHSWLDNALFAEEAARVESHVAECAQCAASVAEARGFIAASSRILTALDDVPRGVVPEAGMKPARKRDFGVLWRAAAAVLVVAGGSLVVLRDGPREERTAITFVDKAVVAPSTPSVAADAGAKAGMATEAAPQSGSASTSERRVARPPVRSDKVAPADERDLSSTIVVRGRTSGTAGAVAQSGTNTPTAPNAAMRVSANPIPPESEAPLLKVLRVERAIGERRTIYEISPTDTVTLTETESLSLSAVVTTGVAAAQDRKQTARRTRAVAPTGTELAGAPAPPATPPADSRTATDSVAVSKEGGAMLQSTAAAPQRDAVNLSSPVSISWFEGTSGKRLVLSGKVSVERLQEIKRRIERERADSIRKNP